MLLLLSILLVLAWNTAGYLGVDRFLLPLLGTPWRVPKVEPQTHGRVAVTA